MVYDTGKEEKLNTSLPASEFTRILTELREELRLSWLEKLIFQEVIGNVSFLGRLGIDKNKSLLNKDLLFWKPFNLIFIVLLCLFFVSLYSWFF